jgi:hypothetical protein
VWLKSGAGKNRRGCALNLQQVLRSSNNRCGRATMSPAPTGITPRQAKQWEKLAVAPDEPFKGELADKTQIPTTSSIFRALYQPYRRTAT